MNALVVHKLFPVFKGVLIQERASYKYFVSFIGEDCLMSSSYLKEAGADIKKSINLLHCL